MPNNGSNSNTSGENTAKFRFTPKGANDKLAQETLDELARRGYVVIEKNEQEGRILYQPNEPDDKTKIWWQTDLNGVELGVPKTYSATEGRWLPISADAYTPPLQRNGIEAVANGNSEVTVNFEDLGTMNYHLSYHFTMFKADGSVQSQPTSVPSAFNSYEKTRTTASFTIAVISAPVGGINIQWEARVIPS